MPRRPTQKDVAAKAGLSRPTVSLALNGSPAVSPETRAYVREVAESMGYRPDPLLSALSKYRNHEEAQHYQGTLAWISYSSKERPWHLITTYNLYYQGAFARAQALGFNIEKIDLLQENLSAKRLDSILKARGIRGIFICPPTKQGEVFDIPYEDYCLVTFGYTIRTPIMHRVSPSHIRATRAIFNSLVERGYRRIGFAGSKEVNLKTLEHCQSAYLCGCRSHGLEFLPELLTDEDFPTKFSAWKKQHKPDAVIITSPMWPVVQQLGLDIPGELGIASPMAPLRHPELSGVVEKSEQIGAAAVDTLIQLIQHDERGIPADPKNILLEGQWNEGSTLRPVR
ncbi:LacI family DNA-binding transcriptional regulator [Cerasicoccus frondis]|uniref:LacI family DNA-binding transcriptional regulator n=1 Tax=Cerasicoccus frondis TaxID=490090 RepID=UPI0028529106|nr:LacI family DNA-binding transcriptional regulator [Cerasicoccus frondis]